MGYSASVLGASGYAGGEVLRLLVAHPALDISAAAAARRSGEAAAAVHPNLLGRDLPELRDLAEVVATPVDVVFSCLPSGRLRPLLEDLRAEVVIDLSDDHRSDPDWTYGLTEFGRAGMPAPRVANPGCYPTGTLLALVPFVRAGAVEGPLVVDALSGVSGAGRRAEDRLLFSSATDNAGAYGTTEHRHIPEVERGLSVFGGTHLG
ncbi:MAG: N-acetyl-gamma-glutamyl-phosphate reductase, partial [Actinomycetota bacterium]